MVAKQHDGGVVVQPKRLELGQNHADVVILVAGGRIVSSTVLCGPEDEEEPEGVEGKAGGGGGARAGGSGVGSGALIN